MGPGSFAGLIIGVLVCAVLAFVAIKVSKKESANTAAILATLTEEQKNEMRNMTYAKADGKDMFSSKGLITSVQDEGEKVAATIMFYMQEHQDFYTRKLKLVKAEAQSKGIVRGAFVPVLMKYDREMHYYDFKKLL